VSFEDLTNDAVAAAKFLQTRTDVAASQIGFRLKVRAGGLLPEGVGLLHKELKFGHCRLFPNHCNSQIGVVSLAHGNDLREFGI
jgi:hypothetical protein